MTERDPTKPLLVEPTEAELAEHGGFLVDVDVLGMRLTPTQQEFSRGTFSLGNYANVLVRGAQTPVTIDSIHQAMGRMKRHPAIPGSRPGTVLRALQRVPAVPLQLLAEGFELRTHPHLHRPYERETFSGGVNLSAQARNRSIDADVFVIDLASIRAIYVSPRTLERIKRLNVTG